jgi:hypothetical protein
MKSILKRLMSCVCHRAREDPTILGQLLTGGAVPGIVGFVLDWITCHKVTQFSIPLALDKNFGLPFPLLGRRSVVVGPL